MVARISAAGGNGEDRSFHQHLLLNGSLMMMTKTEDVDDDDNYRSPKRPAKNGTAEYSDCVALLSFLYSATASTSFQIDQPSPADGAGRLSVTKLGKARKQRRKDARELGRKKKTMTEVDIVVGGASAVSKRQVASYTYTHAVERR